MVIQVDISQPEFLKAIWAISAKVSGILTPKTYKLFCKMEYIPLQKSRKNLMPVFRDFMQLVFIIS